jgi:hypothetical protein
MLACYFDVSGKQDDPEARAFVVAGFGAPVSSWLALDAPWREMLSRAGICEFHMAAINYHKAKGYDHLTGEAYARLMNEAYPLIQQHVAVSFARVIEWKNLHSLVESGRKPFVVAGLSAMQAAETWRGRRNARNRVNEAFADVIFDDGEDGAGALVDATPPGMVKPIFRPSCLFPGLQAADWLAWELSRLQWKHDKHRESSGVPELVAVRGTMWYAQRELPKDWKYYHEGSWVDIFRPR